MWAFPVAWKGWLWSLGWSGRGVADNGAWLEEMMASGMIGHGCSLEAAQWQGLVYGVGTGEFLEDPVVCAGGLMDAG